MVALSLDFELSGQRTLKALDNASIPLLASQRPGYPILLGGGPLAFLNPAPLSPALDAWFVGEAEAGLTSCLELLADRIMAGQDKARVLAEMASWPGFYVPGVSRLPVSPGAGAGRADPDRSRLFHLRQPTRPNSRTPCSLEGEPGLPPRLPVLRRGLCLPPAQAGGHGRPLRPSSPRSGPPRWAWWARPLTDWPDLPVFLNWLKAEKIKFTLSSVRADGITEELLAILTQRRAAHPDPGPGGAERPHPAHGQQEPGRGRVPEGRGAGRGPGREPPEGLLHRGLAGRDDDDDYRELEAFLAQVCRAGRVGGGKRGIGHLTLGVNPLVPKPWTPMQWAPMASEEALEGRAGAGPGHGQAPARGAGGGRQAVSGPHPGPFGPGRRSGLRSEPGWRPSLATGSAPWPPGTGIRPGTWTGERDQDEAFPWECIDVGVSRESLWREWRRYREAAPTPKCPEAACGSCGACALAGG